MSSSGMKNILLYRNQNGRKLKGARNKQWAMTVNGRWRICFEFRKGDAFDVEIVDYHKG